MPHEEEEGEPSSLRGRSDRPSSIFVRVERGGEVDSRSTMAAVLYASLTKRWGLQGTLSKVQSVQPLPTLLALSSRFVIQLSAFSRFSCSLDPHSIFPTRLSTLASNSHRRRAGG
jgi:hypothetical protein